LTRRGAFRAHGGRVSEPAEIVPSVCRGIDLNALEARGLPQVSVSEAAAPASRGAVQRESGRPG
jgi:hypothetical protein